MTAKPTSSGYSTSAATSIGGNTSWLNANTESWNGSSWTEVADLNTARYAKHLEQELNTSALAYGGEPKTTGKTEQWNGSSWSEVADLSTARQHGGGVATSTDSAINWWILVPAPQVA